MPIYRGDGGSPGSTTETTLNAVTEKANEAAVSATNAANSADSAAASATTATTKATAAAASATTASDAVTSTTANANSASTSASNASTSASNALSSANSAASSATSATASATSATSSASSATSSASSASTSATNAASSATAAAASETAAAASETAAGTSETNAAASETAAAASETAAAASESAAATSETNAATSATNAASSATSAASSATAAATSATNAATSATNAATSETNAATSETNAAASETAAATSETNAATSATNAATSATNASTSETNAASSASSAAASYDAFDDRYLGTKTSAPSTDNDGDALAIGALYYNSTAGQMYVWEGTQWEAAYLPATGYLALSGGTMTGAITLPADPTANLEAATKQYVDTIAAAGLHYHDPVRVEKEGNLSATYDNGSSGVGATLTNNSTQEALTIDGVALSLNDRVLVYEQTNAYENGIYYVSTVGDGSTNWVLTRATDADSYGPSDSGSLGEGDAFFVLEGTAGAGELYVMTTSGTITFGTTGINFSQISTAQVYSAGTGISISGSTISSDITLDEVVASGATTSTAVTVGNLTSTGIDDNATSTAITIDSSENVGIGTASPSTKLNVEYGALEAASLHELILNANYGSSSNSGGRIGITFSGDPAGTVGAGQKTAGVYGVSTDTTAFTRSMGLVFNTSATDSVSTERMRIDSSGNVGIGESSNIQAKTHISSGSAGTLSISGSADELLLESGGNAGMTIATPATGIGSIFFTDPGSTARGIVQYNHSTDVLNLGTSGAVKAVIDSSGNVGIGTTSPSEKLNVSGNILATGNVTAYSDARLKDNVETLDGSKVYEMRGVSFTKDGEASSGVIAQELQQIAPELVNDSGEYLSVAYGNLVGYLIEAVKELKAEVEELKRAK